MAKYIGKYKGKVGTTHGDLYNGKIGYYKLEDIPIISLEITGNAEVIEGNTLQLGIEYTPSNTTQQGVVWSSSDETKATVDSNGLVTTISEGTVTITATSISNELVYDELIITVNVEVIPVESITINGTTPIVIGSSEQYTVTYNPLNTTEIGVVWSGGGTIFTVDSNGLVTAKRLGGTNVIATSIHRQDVYGSKTVRTRYPIAITGLSITGETEVVEGNTLQLGIDYTPSDTEQRGVTWKSSDNTKATVDSNGLVTAIGVGNVIITVKSTSNPGISDTHSLEITPELISLTITGGHAVNNGSTIQLSIDYTPSNANQQGVTWSSSDETKATVDSNGLVTAIAEGSVVITAISNINGTISDTHNIIITYPEVNLMGRDDNVGGITYLYEGKYYQGCNVYATENSYQSRTLYDTNTGLALPWSIMTPSEKIAAFGSTGDEWQTYLIGSGSYTPYRFITFTGFNDSTVLNSYYGINVPNGTYRIKILTSWNSSNPNWGLLPTLGNILINDSNYLLPNVDVFNNTTWGEQQDYVVTDGKLLFKFMAVINGLAGFCGINIEKIT